MGLAFLTADVQMLSSKEHGDGYVHGEIGIEGSSPR